MAAPGKMLDVVVEELGAIRREMVTRSSRLEAAVFGSSP
jgi:hypothetical protein